MHWYLYAVIGRDVPGGTETEEIDEYVTQDERPNVRTWARERVKGTGWQVLESSCAKSRANPNHR